MELEIENYQLFIQYPWRTLGWLVEGRLRSNEKWIQIDKRWNDFVKENALPNNVIIITF
jgi:hypothetical protein